MTEVNVGIEKLVDQRAEGVGFGQARHTVAELEIGEDVLNVGGEAVEVIQEILLKLLLAAA